MKSKIIMALAIACGACLGYTVGHRQASLTAESRHSILRCRAAYVPQSLCERWVLIEGWVIGNYSSENEALAARAKIAEREAEAK